MKVVDAVAGWQTGAVSRWKPSTAPFAKLGRYRLSPSGLIAAG
jgi:hypothetical protein